MPIVTIQVINENLTAEKKKQLIDGVTDLVHDVLRKDPERIYVIVQEVPLDNWGAGGFTVSERRAQGFDGLCTCPKHE
ncbi:4-oxalocrotonate tautomerase family protein [Streptosporangium sp. NPDC000239]|uniref:Tautomerase n=2 Tax=Streptosporangium TaxID=2000 RepID=A0ABV8FB11_9ACTN